MAARARGGGPGGGGEEEDQTAAGSLVVVVGELGLQGTDGSGDVEAGAGAFGRAGLRTFSLQPTVPSITP